MKRKMIALILLTVTCLTIPMIYGEGTPIPEQIIALWDSVNNLVSRVVTLEETIVLLENRVAQLEALHPPEPGEAYIPSNDSYWYDQVVDGVHDEWVYPYSYQLDITTTPHVAKLMMFRSFGGDTHEIGFWIAMRSDQPIQYGTQILVALDLNDDGVMVDELDPSSNDLLILWHGDAHGGPGGDGWLRVNYKGDIYTTQNGEDNYPTLNVRASHIEYSDHTDVEIWIPRAYIPENSYETHIRYSPDSCVNYVWENPGVQVWPVWDDHDVSLYGTAYWV